MAWNEPRFEHATLVRPRGRAVPTVHFSAKLSSSSKPAKTSITKKSHSTGAEKNQSNERRFRDRPIKHSSVIDDEEAVHETLRDIETLGKWLVMRPSFVDAVKLESQLKQMPGVLCNGVFALRPADVHIAAVSAGIDITQRIAK